MKNLIVTLLQLFLFAAFVYSNNKELFFELSSEKPVYSEQEEIVINFRLVNKSEQKLTFSDMCVFGCGIFSEFTLSDDKGVIYSYHGPIMNCIDLMMTLKAGEEFSFEEEIIWCFGTEKPGLFNDYLKEGRYTITMPPKKCNDISVNCNVLRFEIKKPGAEDGFDALKSALSIRDSIMKSDSLKNFLYNYPQSAFLFNAFDEFLRLFPTFGQREHEMYDVFKYYLSLRNNSWNARKNVRGIANVIKWLKGDERMINFLAYICKKYPGTKASEAAYAILKQNIPNDFYIKMLIN